MRSVDRAAILRIAEMLAQHLEAGEDKTDKVLLPSDSVRGAILTLSSPPVGEDHIDPLPSRAWGADDGEHEDTYQ